MKPLTRFILTQFWVLLIAVFATDNLREVAFALALFGLSIFAYIVTNIDRLKEDKE